MPTPESPSQAGPLQPHSLTARLFHWGFLGVFLFAISKQLEEVNELEDFALLQYEIVFASLFLVLLAFRFIYMQFTRPSALPDTTAQNTRRLARAVHLSMYGAIALIAVSGLTIGGLYWQGHKAGVWMDSALIVHEFSVIASYWLIAGHVAAAIYHRRQADGVWSTMVPFWKEDKLD